MSYVATAFIWTAHDINAHPSSDLATWIADSEETIVDVVPHSPLRYRASEWMRAEEQQSAAAAALHDDSCGESMSLSLKAPSADSPHAKATTRSGRRLLPATTTRSASPSSSPLASPRRNATGSPRRGPNSPQLTSRVATGVDLDHRVAAHDQWFREQRQAVAQCASEAKSKLLRLELLEANADNTLLSSISSADVDAHLSTAADADCRLWHWWACISVAAPSTGIDTTTGLNTTVLITVRFMVPSLKDLDCAEFLATQWDGDIDFMQRYRHEVAEASKKRMRRKQPSDTAQRLESKSATQAAKWFLVEDYVSFRPLPYDALCFWKRERDVLIRGKMVDVRKTELQKLKEATRRGFTLMKE